MTLPVGTTYTLMPLNREAIYNQIIKKNSFLCIGLDTDISKIPAHLQKESDPVFEFNRQIVDATHESCIAYKPNTAFYESRGAKGWESFEKTVKYIKQNYPEQFVIADAKRGDIGNTSSMYAKAFFENLPCDAVTVAPYMGEDSVKPFFDFKNKWAIVLALTSNKGAIDFQFLPTNIENKLLFEKVLVRAQRWGNPDNMMFVVGATQAEMLKGIRKIVPDHFLLVPGVGAQGGSLQEVAANGMNKKCGLIVNASRSIIYASSEKDFAQKARTEAEKMKEEMKRLLQSELT